MPRGGKRAGAGRTRKLQACDRLAIYARCEQRFNAIWANDRDNRWNRRPGVERLRFLQAKMKAAAPGSREQQQLSASIGKTVRQMKRTPSFVAETRRGFTKSAPRPKGVTNTICQEVAAEFATKWGRPDIGPRYVRRCWDEFRSLERKTAPIDFGME